MHELTYVSGHVNTCLHLWKFATWRFTCRGLTVLDQHTNFLDYNYSFKKSYTLKSILEGLMLKLKLQYFGHLMRRTDSLEKTLMLGKTEGRRRRDHRGWDGWMASLTRWTWVWASSRSWWWTGKPGVLQSMGPQRVRHDWVTELTDWLYIP